MCELQYLISFEKLREESGTISNRRDSSVMKHTLPSYSFAMQRRQNFVYFHSETLGGWNKWQNLYKKIIEKMHDIRQQ